MNNQEIQRAASEYANKHWAVLEKPNEHDNTRDDFLAGARWAAQKLEKEFSALDLALSALKSIPVTTDLPANAPDWDNAPKESNFYAEDQNRLGHWYKYRPS